MDKQELPDHHDQDPLGVHLAAGGLHGFAQQLLLSFTQQQTFYSAANFSLGGKLFPQRHFFTQRETIYSAANSGDL